MSAPASFAITYTVKNEAALLADAISYHVALGCARVYIFFDGSTDDSRAVAERFDRVVCANCVEPGALENPPAWIRDILPRWRDSMDVRKRVNTFVAASLAHQEGIEWLINIDPDELLLFDEVSRDSPGDPARFFATVDPGTEQLLVANLEAVPIGAGTGRPFVDCTCFLRRFPATEFLWRASAVLVRQVVSSPKAQAWFDHWFYRIRFAGALPRLFRHPASGELIPAGYFLGYSNHKAFIRTSVASEFRFNIHRWERVQRAPRTIRRGSLLHYDLCSAEYFSEKFRQRQPAMLVKAFYVRYMFALIARELPLEDVRRFFLEQICIRQPRVLERLRRRGVLLNIDCIARLLGGPSASTAAARTGDDADVGGLGSARSGRIHANVTSDS